MINWQKRFSNQLKWTKKLRDYLFQKIEIDSKRSLLEIGCGPGELLKEIGSLYNVELTGIDIDGDRIQLARESLKQSRIKASLIHKDFLKNTFADQEFDVIITNCVFLWINELRETFKEIHRILKPEGNLLIFGEPDYGGLIEYPDTGLKKALFSNLIKEGADPEAGRKLNQFFHGNFKVIEKFSMSVPWIADTDKESLFKEMKFFSRILIDEEWNPNMMRISIERNNYFIFVPVFSYHLEKIGNMGQ